MVGYAADSLGKLGRKIFEAARHPKSFISLDTADHLMTRREDSTYAAETLAAWVSRYLPQVEEANGGYADQRDE